MPVVCEELRRASPRVSGVQLLRERKPIAAFQARGRRDRPDQPLMRSETLAADKEAARMVRFLESWSDDPYAGPYRGRRNEQG